jgi:rRNA maturation endonuclease Nob1
MFIRIYILTFSNLGMEKEDWRAELNKYYKFVMVCSECKKEYGTNRNKMDNGICPVCENKMNDIKGVFEQ